MDKKRQKKLKGTLTDYNDRLKTVEETLHKERLSKWQGRAMVGLVLHLFGTFYDQIACFLARTRHFSFVYSEGIGLAQFLLMGISAILILVSAYLYEHEVRNYVDKSPNK